MNERPLRWAWLLPAVAAAVITIAVVAMLDLVFDDEPEGLPRTSVEPAAASATPSSSAGGDHPDAGGPANIDFLHLRGDGLDMIPFGASQHDIVETLTDVLGTPDEESDEPCEARPESMSHWVRWADLSVRIEGDAFVGYIEGIHFPPGPPPFDLATPRGLSPGDLLSDARELYGELPITPGDPEPGQGAADLVSFSDPDGTGEMSGLVEDAPDGQLVAAIFAGDLC